MVNRFIERTGKPIPPEPKFGRLKAILFVMAMIGFYVLVELINKMP